MLKPYSKRKPNQNESPPPNLIQQAQVPSAIEGSGVGTNFVLGGPRCIGKGGPKQLFIIMIIIKSTQNTHIITKNYTGYDGLVN